MITVAIDGYLCHELSLLLLLFIFCPCPCPCRSALLRLQLPAAHVLVTDLVVRCRFVTCSKVVEAYLGMPVLFEYSEF
eukprot:6346875-Amphidinium_carterae.1